MYGRQNPGQAWQLFMNAYLANAPKVALPTKQEVGARRADVDPAADRRAAPASRRSTAARRPRFARRPPPTSAADDTPTPPPPSTPTTPTPPLPPRTLPPTHLAPRLTRRARIRR